MAEALSKVISLFLLGLTLALFGVSFSLKKKLNKVRVETEKEKAESARRLYEIAILKEIGDRAGYSLNVEEILQIITGSLRQFINYSAVSYIVIQEDRLKMHTHLEESLAKPFISSMKERMLASINALLDKPVVEASVEEVISGAISMEEMPKEIGSFFNIPLVIGGKLSGILTIASVKKGLYKEEDMSILYKITAQASNAVTRLEEVVRIEEEKLSKIREEYTSMIVHELRSPLDGMKKIVELIVSGTIEKNSPKFDEYISLLHQSSSSTLELVNDILDYSKIQAGKLEINPVPANLPKVINNRISFYEALASTRKLNLSSYCEESLNKDISFDEKAVRQILNNFISNALKFTFEGGKVSVLGIYFGGEGSEFSKEAQDELGKIPVKITESDITLKGKSAVVLVSDSGLGIPEDKKKDLFKTYKQLSSTNFSEAKGTGLGLVIAKGMVEAHKGQIGFVSQDKIGSTFFFAIPIA